LISEYLRHEVKSAVQIIDFDVIFQKSIEYFD